MMVPELSNVTLNDWRPPFPMPVLVQEWFRFQDRNVSVQVSHSVPSNSAAPPENWNVKVPLPGWKSTVPVGIACAQLHDRHTRAAANRFVGVRISVRSWFMVSLSLCHLYRARNSP